jgi:hypothetical protein
MKVENSVPLLQTEGMNEIKMENRLEKGQEGREE